METIRVNMTPCEDIKTIHASQNDNEAREWGFELHNNGEKIDSSSISDQLVFKAYEGGTEEILPTNGSTPTTSPFLGDIKYPQGLLSDQEFLYRESPTEEDGLAKITDIKGNTLNWNQLVQNGNFADGLTNWEQASATLSVSNGVCRATFTGIAWNNDIRQSVAIKSGHRYLIVCDYLMSAEFGDLVFTAIFGQSGFSVPIRNQRVKSHLASIFTSTGNITSVRFATVSSMESYSGQYYEISNVNLFDLTQMFGSGNEPSTVEEFTSLFSLPYYAYNQGTLLSFNGNGIKTVGKNQLALSIEPYNTLFNLPLSGYFYVLKGTYTISYTSNASNRVLIKMVDANGNYLSDNAHKPSNNVYWSNSYQGWYIGSDRQAGQIAETITIAENCYIRIGRSYTNPDTIEFTNCQLEFGSTATSYEPYTSSTLSLPISTYFTNGMKSAGNVYDELTETKAITRVGSRAYQSGDESDTSVITDGTTTYYVLATPTETSFTTASLVTENAEIPLSNEDGVLIGKCIEQLSSESGFFDAKIKLTDEDGECYSNKIQLHIERSPQ